MKKIKIMIMSALFFGSAVFAADKIPAKPDPLPKAVFNEEGIPTNDVKGYEWQKWPGEDWKRVKLADNPKATSAVTADNAALAEVNAARSARGLRPFVCDPALCVAAESVATYRARHGIAGHTQNDFAYLPSGCSADAAGCAAWPVGMGWGSCCTYDNYVYAGAAAVVGADGRRYMSLFVRNSAASSSRTIIIGGQTFQSCPNGQCPKQ